MLVPIGGRRVLSETADRIIYSYHLQGNSCAWEVTVAKTTTVVLGWNFLSLEAEAACNELPAKRGV